MKRILSYVLLLGLLGGTSIWAYNRDKNNEDSFSQSEKFGTRRSEDSEGTLETQAHVQIDVDYPDEDWYIWKYGIEIEAYAKVHADWGFHHEREYSLAALAETTPRRKTTTQWSLRASKSLRDRYFDRYHGDEADQLKDWDADDVRGQFSRGRARGSIDQTLSSGSGSGSDPGYESTAEVN